MQMQKRFPLAEGVAIRAETAEFGKFNLFSAVNFIIL